MQRNTVTVRLAGDLGNTVEKYGVSPAEIMILRAIHGGDDTVVNVRPTIMDSLPHIQERARLENIYGAAMVDAMFPGKLAQLPVSNSDIGIERDAPEEPMTAPPVPEGSEAPGVPDDGMVEDDFALIEVINGAKTKAELRDLAIQNEVDLTDIPDRMDAMRHHIIKELFPTYKG